MRYVPLPAAQRADSSGFIDLLASVTASLPQFLFADSIKYAVCYISSLFDLATALYA